MKLLQLFIASSKPVVETLLITSVGFYLALDGVNLLGHEARKHLNNVHLKLSFTLFFNKFLFFLCGIYLDCLLRV